MRDVTIVFGFPRGMGAPGAAARSVGGRPVGIVGVKRAQSGIQSTVKIKANEKELLLVPPLQSCKGCKKSLSGKLDGQHKKVPGVSTGPLAMTLP